MVEDLHQQQNPLTPFSIATIIYDWTIIGMYTSHHLSKWAQHDNVTSLANIALTPDGNPIAFTIHNIIFFSQGHHQLQHSYALTHLTSIITATICWHQQKNKCKGEKKFLVPAPDSPVLCTILAPTHIVQCWLDLNLPTSYPLAIFTTTGLPTGSVTFIQAQHITSAFWASAQ